MYPLFPDLNGLKLEKTIYAVKPKFAPRSKCIFGTALHSMISVQGLISFINLSICCGQNRRGTLKWCKEGYLSSSLQPHEEMPTFKHERPVSGVIHMDGIPASKVSVV